MKNTSGNFSKNLVNPEVRKMYRADPKAAHKKMLAKFPELPKLKEGVELKVVFNTADKTYVVFPRIDTSYILQEQQLNAINAAGQQGVSTLATICSSVSTASTAPY